MSVVRRWLLSGKSEYLKPSSTGSIIRDYIIIPHEAFWYEVYLDTQRDDYDGMRIHHLNFRRGREDRVSIILNDSQFVALSNLVVKRVEIPNYYTYTLTNSLYPLKVYGIQRNGEDVFFGEVEFPTPAHAEAFTDGDFHELVIEELKVFPDWSVNDLLKEGGTR